MFMSLLDFELSDKVKELRSLVERLTGAEVYLCEK